MAQIQEKWFNCKVLHKYYKDGWFGRKYYVVLSIEGQPAQEMKCGIGNYYMENIGSIKMYSIDGINWNSNRNHYE